MNEVENGAKSGQSERLPSEAGKGEKIANDTELEGTSFSKSSSRDLAHHANGEETKTDDRDPIVVSWDGADDPANPKNWSFKRRWAATALVSLLTFMTTIASSMVAPAEAAIDRDLRVKSTIETELIFSIILLAFVIGPLFLAPLSEVYGRVVVLQLANIWFLIFNLACGFAQNVEEMLAFRFLAGLGGCAPQTIGGGVLSDLWTPEERGQAVALYALAPILGPAIGPLVGAWIAERTTWRWSFWAVTIFGVVVQVLFYFAASETYGPLILQRKAQRLRTRTGNERLRTQYETEDRSLRTVLKTALIRVFVLLVTQPIVQFLATYGALIYGIVYLMLATFPQVWTNVYHESIGIGGLNYVSLMIGLTVGAQVAGRLADRLYRTLKSRSANGEGRPEFRVPLLFLATIFIASGLFMYGWSVQTHTHWIVPNIGAAIFSAGVSFSFTGQQTYVIDCYQLHAASAIGATAVARSITGFCFPLFADYMYDALGEGWGNSVLAFAAIGVGFFGSLVLWFLGPRLRQASQYAAGT